MFSVVDGEAVILELDRGEYYGLNDVGTRVWQLLEKEASVDGVVDKLLEEFEVDRETLAADVLELLQDLEGHQLLQRADRGDGHAPTG
jgi:hypothetical protein